MAGKEKAKAKAKQKQSQRAQKRSHGGREEAGWVYHLNQAKWHCRSLKETVMVKLAKTIEEKNWTQAKAAQFLGVSQPRISDLMRGHANKFTLDALVEMLYALDKPVAITIDGNPEWGLSNASPTSEKERDQMLAYYNKVIMLEPDDVNAIRKRADIFEEQGKYELAIGDYTRCIELEPDKPGARIARALAFKDSGQYKAALKDCDELLRLFPGNNTYQNRGIIYQAMGEFEKAMEDHSKAIEMDPQRPGPHWNRASLNERLGRFEEAIRDYENTLKADPTYKRAREAIDRIKQQRAI